MEGYLRLRINPWVRRLLTRLVAIVPAFIVITVFGDNEVDSLLILSQVILSLQLGFAIIPLIHFVSDKNKMGAFTIRPVTQILAWIIALILVYLNLKMLTAEFGSLFSEEGLLFWKILVIVAGLGFLTLLGYITFIPFFKKTKPDHSISMHRDVASSLRLQKPVYKKIAVALEFSEFDHKLISHAISQGQSETRFLLIHVVESPSTVILGKESDDYETRRDTEQINNYKKLMEAEGLEVETKLGFHDRAREIARLVNDGGADLLVIGAHGHSGLKDFLYGETINSVRHELKIPILVVNI
jgi:manganese transport protein